MSLTNYYKREFYAHPLNGNPDFEESMTPKEKEAQEAGFVLVHILDSHFAHTIRRLELLLEDRSYFETIEVPEGIHIKEPRSNTRVWVQPLKTTQPNESEISVLDLDATDESPNDSVMTYHLTPTSLEEVRIA